MKKIIIMLFVISSIYIFNNKNEIIIPNDAIRFRIIANSNSLEDQNIKKIIKEDLINNFMSKIKTREDISNNIGMIDNILKSYNINYDINYGINYFPEKEYNGVKYPKGNYESLVITLEDGLGDNYWCVMYPPLCLIENNESNKVEYKLMYKQILDSYKNNVN